MMMRTFRARALGLLLCFLLCAAGASAGTVYTVGVLQSPAGLGNFGGPVMYGIDDLGQAAGEGIDAGENDVSFLGTTSGSPLIPAPAGWNWVSATAINELA
jgi:hypothetical protein